VEPQSFHPKITLAHRFKARERHVLLLISLIHKHSRFEFLEQTNTGKASLVLGREYVELGLQLGSVMDAGLNSRLVSEQGPGQAEVRLVPKQQQGREPKSGCETCALASKTK
jgi:hypothetical protein